MLAHLYSLRESRSIVGTQQIVLRESTQIQTSAANLAQDSGGNAVRVVVILVAIPVILVGQE
jgi:hypothetical protein